MSLNKNRKKPVLFRKCEIDDVKDLHLPLPTQVISNEEHLPIPQTEAQKRVEYELTELAETTSKRLGMSRRQFLATSGGMAAAFLTMNSVFGKFFDVEASELTETSATSERIAKKECIFDIHTHRGAAGRVVPPLIGYRKFAE